MKYFLLLIIFTFQVEATTKPEPISLFDCSSEEVENNKVDIDNIELTRKSLKASNDILKNFKNACPSPYNFFRKLPKYSINTINKPNEIKKSYCLSKNHNQNKQTLRGLNKNLFKSCYAEYEAFYDDYNSQKHLFQKQFLENFSLLPEPKIKQKFEIGTNLYETATEDKFELYKSNRTFSKGLGISQWVQLKEEKLNDNKVELTKYFGIDEQGEIKKSVISLYVKSQQDYSKVMGICHRERSAIFGNDKFLKLIKYEKDNKPKHEIYFTKKTKFIVECSPHNANYSLTIYKLPINDDISNQELLEEVSIKKFHELIVNNKNQIAQRFFIKEEERIKEIELIKKSNKVVEDIYRLCPSPLSKLLSDASVKHIYETANHVKDFPLYKEKIDSKFSLNVLNKITQQCIDELVKINHKWVSKKNEIIDKHKNSMENTSRIDHQLFGIYINKQIPLNLINLDEVKFEEGYYSTTTVREKTPQLQKLTAYTEVILDKEGDSLPKVVGIKVMFKTQLDTTQCKAELSKIREKLIELNYFPDTKFSHKRYRYYKDSITLIGEGVVFNGYCDIGRGKFELRSINNYVPNFNALTLDSLQL